MEVSQLQQHFPLSPKKFWKKFIESIFSFFTIVPVVVIGFTFATLPNLVVLGWQSVIGLFVIALVLVIIGFVCNVWYIKEYIKRYYYSGDDNFITIKKGVFAPTEIHVQFQKIQDVYVDQDILDRLMGLYDVHIASATATSGIEAHIDGVEEEAAEGLKAMFLGRISSSGNNLPPASSSVSAPITQSSSSSSDQNISSQTYPITSRWLVLSFAGTILVGVVMFFVGLAFWTLFSPQGAGQVTDISNSVALGVILLCAILLTIFELVITFIWKKNFKFELTSDHVYCYKGVISTEEKRMPYTTVQDVTVSQGIIQRIFGLASVNVKNAATQTFYTKNGGQQVVSAGGITIPGQYIDNARKLADAIKSIVLSRNSSKTGI